MNVGLVTCSEFPTLVEDDRLLLAELERLGLRVQPLVWDDASVDWAGARVCVIRSAWDYHHRREEFVAWAERVGRVTKLHNPAAVVRWNTHKSYLRELEARGVPIVPTVWLDAGTRADIRDIMSTKGWEQAVIKPAVSASAYETTLVDHKSVEAGQAHIDRLLQARALMVQPFMESVQDYGERSLMFIDGEFTHAVRRPPMLGEKATESK